MEEHGFGCDGHLGPLHVSGIFGCALQSSDSFLSMDHDVSLNDLQKG